VIIRIEMSILPPKQLSPNARVHWSVRHQYASELRVRTKFCALEATKYRHPSLSKAEVSISFVVPDKRYIKDTDNALASIKAAIDGCVDAGIIVDDDPGTLTYKMPVEWTVDKRKSPLTVLEFRSID